MHVITDILILCLKIKSTLKIKIINILNIGSVFEQLE